MTEGLSMDIEKSLLVKCEPACPPDTDEELSNFVECIKNGSTVKVESQASFPPNMEFDPFHRGTEDVTTMENVQLASGMTPLKQETKAELTETGPVQENTFELVDIKDEISIEEHLVDQLVSCIQEENNGEFLQIQNKGPLHQCSGCCKAFNRRSHLKRHLLTHTAVREYSCSECNRPFTQKGNLKTHMLTHSKKKPYICETCDKTFVSGERLKIHLLQHSNEMPHNRSVCKKKFALRERLNRHMLTHSDYKPYHCNKCDSSFSRKYYLTTHLFYHSNDRPCRCNECNKTFARKADLRNHLVTHSTVRPYRCTICGKAFALPGSLKRRLFPLRRTAFWLYYVWE